MSTFHGRALIGVLLLLSACAPHPEKSARITHFDTAAKGPPSHRIDATRSSAQILVYRAGLVSGLGHNHIVLNRNIQGAVWLDPVLQNSAFYLRLPVESFIVDPAELRAQAGADFSSKPGDGDIAGTRNNMLGERILDAAHHPFIELWSERIEGAAPALTASVILAARGTLYRIEMPLNLEMRNGSITANGNFSLKQTDIGIEPFSILMGAIAVRDELEIEYAITASAD